MSVRIAWIGAMIKKYDVLKIRDYFVINLIWKGPNCNYKKLIRDLNEKVQGLNYKYEKVMEFSTKLQGPKHN
jgi:hypothetical protein